MVCLVGGTYAGTHTIEGSIVGVHVGDTITRLDVNKSRHKIRLDGVDAPPSCGNRSGEHRSST